VLALILLIAVSMAGFTLGAYVRQVKLFNSGWIGPKYFAFEIANSVSHRDLQPGASVSYPFTVTNHNSGGTAQVDLQVTISISYPTSLAGTGTVRATLTSGGQTLATSESGTLEATGTTLPANVQTTGEYTLTLTWLNADLTYLSDKTTQAFDDSQIHVSVSGYQ
jgi:hypothetical protein